MRKLALVLFAGLVLVLAAGPAAMAADGDEILGTWRVDDGKATIQMYKCNDKYCGKIVGLKEPKYEDGTDKVDKENPNEAKRSRKLLGLVMVWGFKFVGDNKYEDGGIYAPDTGKTYSCKATLKDANTLDVRGFIGISLLGRTSTWKRVN